MKEIITIILVGIIMVGGFVVGIFYGCNNIQIPIWLIIWCTAGPIIGIILMSRLSKPMKEPWVHDDY